MERTYLHDCLKEGLTVRWPDSAMPIKVYVAPFRWYEKSKQNESYAYNQMVFDAFDLWSRASEGRVRFKQTAPVQAQKFALPAYRQILFSHVHHPLPGFRFNFP
jgi:hypothetical protein